MLTLILFSVVLVIIQIFTPLIMNMDRLSYFLSDRSEEVVFSEATQRAKRAANNVLETYPIFLVLAVLSIHYGIESHMAAVCWLILRIIHFASYIFGIGVLRSISFAGSLVCLAVMGEALYASQTL